MRRLILVPQYPARLRYQEWWFEEFPKELEKYFDLVIVLGKQYRETEMLVDTYSGNFAPMETSIDFELQQIREFMSMDLYPNDVLLLNDLSFPGLFVHTLFHKRPDNCYAICHATSLNRYDYFAEQRSIKYPIEKSVAKLFNGIFVATKYHRQKLGWDNIHNIGMPDSTMLESLFPYHNKRDITFISASRYSIQKRTKRIEKAIEKEFKEKIHTTQNCVSWEGYYKMLSRSKILVITSKEETYGYQVIDALQCGCKVIAPKKYSYPELLPNYCLYENINQCIEIIHDMLKEHIPVSKNLMQKEAGNFFENIYKIIQS